MSGSEGLDAVEAALPATPGGRRIGLHHAIDVVLVHLLGDATVERLADRGRRNRGEAVSRVGIAATAQMRDLAHESGTARVHALTEALQVRDDGIRSDVQLTKYVRRVAVDVRRAAKHRQPNAAPRLLLMVALIGPLRYASNLEPGRVTRAHDAVAELDMADCQGPQERILGGDGGIGVVHRCLLDPARRRGA